MTLKQLNIRVHGKVQGVWFRKFVKDMADNLKVKGIVMNEPDKTVFIVAQGNSEQLNDFITYCKQGPRLAEVSNLHVEEDESLSDFTEFQIIKN